MAGSKQFTTSHACRCLWCARDDFHNNIYLASYIQYIAAVYYVCALIAKFSKLAMPVGIPTYNNNNSQMWGAKVSQIDIHAQV